MGWTVGQRIGAGFAAMLALIVVVTLAAGWSLNRTVGAYEQALRDRRAVVVPALRAESDIRAASTDYTRFLLERNQSYLASRDSLIQSARAFFAETRDSSGGAEDRARWADIVTLVQRWDDASRASIAALRAGNDAEALRIRSTQAQQLRDQLDSRIREVSLRAQRRSEGIASGAADTAAAARTALVIGAFLVLLVGAIAGWLLTRSINRPLRETTAILASSAAEILSSTTEQAAGANESMAAVTETVATADEVAQTAAQAAERARAVADSAQRAAEIGQEGRRAVADSRVAMHAVQEQVESIAQSIVALAEQAQAIGEIITSVNEVAERTNLLALNAAVEAARAGESGRGFAVVASEVKNLAEQSKASTVQVRQILGEIQRATSSAVMATEQGTKRVATAAKQLEQAGGTISTLADAVADSAQAAAQIVASAGQQAIGMEQIRVAISNIREATHQNLTATKQSEIAAQQINQLGSRLVQLVGTTGRAS
ncbi:MAG: HAMP domain-containing methyl-accepting chemotaxis protein [Gemmatimonadaceae bacterium]